MDYAGDEHEARRALRRRERDRPQRLHRQGPEGGRERGLGAIVAVGGEIIARPASSREGPPAPPETDAGGGTAPDEGGAPDTADTPSPHLSGAAQAQATADKRKAAKK
jgi:hypothetical protein